MKVVHTIILFSIIVLMVQCTETSKNNPPLLTIERGDFEIIIPARGELQATKSTVINVPQKIRGGLILEWIEAENSMVKKDDVVLRFDGEDFRNRIASEQRNLTVIALDIAEKQAQLVFNKWQNTSLLETVIEEWNLTSTYSPADDRIFSRNEIEEARMDAVYLAKQRENVQENLDRYAEKAAAELQLLELKKQTYTMKLDQMKETLELLEVKAPHDGLFVYKRNWWGEKPMVGTTVWGGIPLAELPDLSTMEARVFVLESEAGGLEQELDAEITLDALARSRFRGKVKSVATLAQPRKKDIPINFFEVLIALDTTDNHVMKPGSQVSAKIFVEKQNSVIVIPNQALFVEEEETYVYVWKGDRFEKRIVQTSSRSITQTIISSGLDVGEQVALKQPESEDE